MQPNIPIPIVCESFPQNQVTIMFNSFNNSTEGMRSPGIIITYYFPYIVYWRVYFHHGVENLETSWRKHSAQIEIMNFLSDLLLNLRLNTSASFI